MKKYNSLSEAIHSIGKHELSAQMSQAVGKPITWQNVHNWLTRGVPYKWHDDFHAITGLNKSLMRKTEVKQ